MKLTIDNNDGNGPIDYTSSIVAGRPFRIVRKLNQPVTCAVTLLPASSLATPARNGRVVVADESGNVLFTGYVATEPALELAGQGSMGAVYQAVVSAISDEILLDRQSIPQIAPLCGTTGGQALQAMLALLDIEAITASVSSVTMNVSDFQSDSACTWSENAGALAASVRSAYLLMNGTLSMTPVGSVTHSLSESQGNLSLSGLQVAMVKALANDVTVCGEVEPSAYVTEFFQGDGTTVLFDLTEAPWMPPPSKSKPLSDNFQGPTVNSQIWNVADPGAALALTSAGLTCGGGGSKLGTTSVSAISNLELGGGLVIEVGGVQFGQNTSGVINGFFGAGQTILSACLAGFQIGQISGATTIAPIMNGVVAGSTFTTTARHLYTLRLRFYANDIQRLLQAYYAVGTANGLELFGGTLLPAVASIVFEVQDTTNGIAGTPTVLYSGSFTTTPRRTASSFRWTRATCSAASATSPLSNRVPSGSPARRPTAHPSCAGSEPPRRARTARFRARASSPFIRPVSRRPVSSLLSPTAPATAPSPASPAPPASPLRVTAASCPEPLTGWAL